MSVQPGVYKIKNAASGTYLDASAKHQGQVHGWGERQGNKNQEWEVQPGQDGGYTLKNLGQNRYASADSPADGTRVEASQQPYEWDIKQEGGKYAICVRNGGTCVDLDNGSREDGASVCLWGNRGAEQQQWEFESQGGGSYSGGGGGQQAAYGAAQASGYSQGGSSQGGGGGGSYVGSVQPGAYHICNAQAGTNMDLAGGGGGDNVPVLGWQGSGGPNQIWELESGQNGYRIKNRQSGSYLGYQGQPNEGTFVTGCTQPVEFQVTAKDNGCHQIHVANNPNLVVDLAGGGSDNGVKILLYNNGGGNNQQWKLEPA